MALARAAHVHKSPRADDIDHEAHKETPRAKVVALEPLVQTHRKKWRDQTADSIQRDMHAHVLRVALWRREILVAQIPRQTSAGETNAKQRAGNIKQRHGFGQRRDKNQSRRADKCPRVNGAEINHMRAVKSPRPKWNGQRHDQQRNHGGHQNSLRICRVHFIL